MEITLNELKSKIGNGEKLLIDFYGKFCGPCKIMKPWFESVANEFNQNGSDVQLYTFDIDSGREYVIEELGLKSVPTIKGFNGGKEVYHSVGVLKKEEIIKIANEL